MSEFEKQQRDTYQNNRNRLIYIQAAIAIVLVIVTFVFSVFYVKLNKDIYVTYTQSGNVVHKAYLKDESVQDDSYAYLSDNISFITANFGYDLAMGASSVNYKYTYRVDAEVYIKDPKSGLNIYHSPYELIPQKTQTVENSSGFSIRELVQIDYNKYNREAERFIGANSLKDVNLQNELVVRMHVSMVGISESFVESKTDEYVIELYLPLVQKIVTPTVSSSVPSNEQKILVMDTNVKLPFMICAIVFGSLAVFAWIALAVFVRFTRDKHTNYARKVKQILSSYKSYIQRITNSFDPSGYQILFVSKITELLEIRDALQMPILAHENEDKTCTRFLIATNTNVLYVYDVAVEEDEVPAEEEELVEEPLVEEEPIVEPETLDKVEPEDNRVDVIDVVWPEHEGKSNERTYRYDPNGENVDKGDTVLVPSVDAFSSKNITRNAKVKRGNYKMDPSKLPHPLKKIICVIKRNS